MKKFLFATLLALSVISCINEDDYQNKVEYVLGATFEYYQYNMSDLFGSDSLYFDAQHGLGLTWNDMAFFHRLDEKKENFKGGFVLSCLKGRVYEAESVVGDSDMYRANAPADSTSTYMVFADTELMPDHDVEFLASQFGTCEMLGCLVNVPVSVAEAATRHFKDGDMLVLRATGFKGGKQTGEAAIRLIEFTEPKDSIVSRWTMFDLSKLGDVQYVEFDVESSVAEVPEMFCMDNMVAKVNIAY